MWKDKIKEIIYMLENSDVNEIEVKFWFKKIKVTKNPHILNVDSTQLSSNNQNIPNIINEEPINQSLDETSMDKTANLIEIKSPMPGTFYSAPDPESSSFFSVGDKVNVGDTICIVEAMKIMNEIQAEQPGIIEEIMVSNSSPVEFDQVLFKLKPSS